MNDLISRQAAIDAIDAILPAEPMKNEYTQGITCGAALAIEYVKQLPSAQPERNKGEWIETEFLKLRECSCCHVRWGMYDVENFNFCPNCGAEMKGESNG